jgi:DNA ligase-associated metallophosphoesterase
MDDLQLTKPALSVSLAGEPVELHADRALYHPRTTTLYVADVHLGKTAAFRAAGVPLPAGTTASNLTRLARLVAATGAERLVVLGDLLHAATGRTPALDSAYRAWQLDHRALSVVLVRGNHDDRAGDPPADWNIEVVDEPSDAPPFLLCHKPPAMARDGAAGGAGTATRDLFGYTLCGHVHPGVFLSVGNEPGARLPCFVLGATRAILPAFGRFTGLYMLATRDDDTVVAIAGARLFMLPPSLRRRA